MKNKLQDFLYSNTGKALVFILAMALFLGLAYYGVTHGGGAHRVIIVR